MRWPYPSLRLLRRSVSTTTRHHLNPSSALPFSVVMDATAFQSPLAISISSFVSSTSFKPVCGARAYRPRPYSTIGTASATASAPGQNVSPSPSQSNQQSLPSPASTSANSLQQQVHNERHRLQQQRHLLRQPASPAATDDPLHPRLRKGDILDVRITRLGYGGCSIGEIVESHHHALSEADAALPIYCPRGACPGDVVRVAVTRVRRRGQRPNGKHIVPPPDAPPVLQLLSAPQLPTQRRQRELSSSDVPSVGLSASPGPEVDPSRSYAEAVYQQLVQASSSAVEPLCRHFGHSKLGGAACGGCSSMHVAYDVQVAQKQQQVSQLFANIVDEHRVTVRPILRCEQMLEFRNKMEFTFGRRWYTSPKQKQQHEDDASMSEDTSISNVRPSDEPDFAIGLHAPLRYDKVVEITDCRVQPGVANQILDFIRAAAKDMLLEPYDTRNNTGYLRHVSIRTSTNAGGGREIMVNLITSPCDVPKRLVPLAEALCEQFPDIVCVVQNIRGIRGLHVTEEDQQRLLAGSRAFIEQELLGLVFRISPNSFFQTNPVQAEVLYNEVRAAADLTPEDTVLDLFCGTGTIGLCLAKDAKQVYGIDVIEVAIEDALVNAAKNRISNAAFLQMNLDKIRSLHGFEVFPTSDVVVVDPPRAGLHPDLVKYFAMKCSARRIVYVSCNPMTQVRDIMQLMRLAPGKYRVASIQPVDMFPHTHHVECVTALERC